MTPRVKRGARILGVRQRRYTKVLPLRLMVPMYDEFAALVRPDETLSEAVRRVFLAGITAVKAAENPAQGGA